MEKLWAGGRGVGKTNQKISSFDWDFFYFKYFLFLGNLSNGKSDETWEIVQIQKSAKFQL